MAEEVRSTIQKRDGKGIVRHGAEWLTIWSDPDSLKTKGERRADADLRQGNDDFRTRVCASSRSLSGDPGFILDVAQPGEGAGLHFGDLTGAAGQIAAMRGEADAQAAYRRFHDGGLHARQRPADPDEARMFDLMEHARCEGRAARAYPGLTGNLTARHIARLRQADLLNAHLASLIPLAEALRMVLRDTFTGQTEASVQTAGFRMWDGWLRARFSDHLDSLAAALDNQAGFAEAAGAFLTDLFGELPGRGRLVRRLSPTAPDDSPGEDRHALRETDDPTLAPLFEPGEEAGPEALPAVDAIAASAAAPEPYRVFTTRHDRIAAATDLFDLVELSARRKALDLRHAAFRREVARLSAGLQRRLMALQARHWDFDLDEGLIDASRLDRVILSPSFAAAYKQEAESPFRNAVVTLLIDNSGSMRGRPIETACITADIVAAALERCSVACEILGFTTVEWKGGQAARDWKAAGRPANPGRLNDVLHVVFKDADTPLRRARDAIAAMLMPSLLKENVDGEALLWAASRLLRRPEARKLLIVISDGAPVDQATIEANDDKQILDRHLRESIAWIARSTSIELAAIGLKHDVGSYYGNAIRIENADDLAGVVTRLIDRSLIHPRGELTKANPASVLGVANPS